MINLIREIFGVHFEKNRDINITHVIKKLEMKALKVANLIPHHNILTCIIVYYKEFLNIDLTIDGIFNDYLEYFCIKKIKNLHDYNELDYKKNLKLVLENYFMKRKEHEIDFLISDVIRNSCIYFAISHIFNIDVGILSSDNMNSKFFLFKTTNNLHVEKIILISSETDLESRTRLFKLLIPKNHQMSSYYNKKSRKFERKFPFIEKLSVVQYDSFKAMIYINEPDNPFEIQQLGYAVFRKNEKEFSIEINFFKIYDVLNPAYCILVNV